MLYNF